MIETPNFIRNIPKWFDTFKSVPKWVRKKIIRLLKDLKCPIVALLKKNSLSF
jgi:hypothetical protein